MTHRTMKQVMSTADIPPLPALAKEKEEQDDEAQSYQPLGLLDTCVKTLARHLEVFAHRRNRYRIIPIDLFLRILRGCHLHAWVQAADTMLRVVQIMPCLDAPEVDELYWRTVCKLTLSPTTPITMPYGILLSRVMELKKALEEWIAAAVTRAAALVAASEKQEGQWNDRPDLGGSITTERKETKKKERYCVAKEEIKGEKDKHQAKSSKKDKSSYNRHTYEEDKKKKKEKRENKDSRTTGIDYVSKTETKSIRDGPSRSTDSSTWSSRRRRSGSSGSSSSSSSTAKTPTKQRYQQEDQANAAVLHLLRELSRIPMSVQLLKDALGLGDAVRMLGGKVGGDVVVSEEVAQAAIKLRRQWKALVQQEEKEAREKEEEKGEGKEGERSDDLMSPARVGARALAALSWRHVYIFSLEYEKHRTGWIGKRALALAEDHESKKRRTRGIEEMMGDSVAIEAEMRKGKPPAGNTDKIRKLIKYKPAMQIKNEKKPFGGITFVAPQKKKSLKVVNLR